MQEIDVQFHIRCKEGDVGRYCFLPGDPALLILQAPSLYSEIFPSASISHKYVIGSILY